MDAERLALEATIVARVILAAALGLLVGREREFRGKRAGERTFALVAAGAAMLASIAVEITPRTAGQVLAGVATGIGFLGIGIIWRGEVGQARGLTTAAAIWATAATGALVGTGSYLAGSGVGLFIFVVLEFDRLPGLRAVHRRIMRADGPVEPDDEPDG